MIKYEDIAKANKKMKPVDIKGKPYVEVHQRIKAFRMVYPQGFIETELLQNENGVCVFKATVGYTYTVLDNDKVEFHKFVLGTGTAYEKENSSFINKTSFIENCETSAIGRALGIAGFGIDTSVSSAEDIEKTTKAVAVQKEEIKATKEQIKFIEELGLDLGKVYDFYKIDNLSELTLKQASEIIKQKGDGSV